MLSNIIQHPLFQLDAEYLEHILEAMDEALTFDNFSAWELLLSALQSALAPIPNAKKLYRPIKAWFRGKVQSQPAKGLLVSISTAPDKATGPLNRPCVRANLAQSPYYSAQGGLLLRYVQQYEFLYSKLLVSDILNAAQCQELQANLLYYLSQRKRAAILDIPDICASIWEQLGFLVHCLETSRSDLEAAIREYRTDQKVVELLQAYARQAEKGDAELADLVQ